MKTAVLGAWVIMMLSGCASILSGTSEEINVSTSPVTADLVVKYGPRELYRGPSPYRGKTGKRFSTRVTAKAEGYHSQSIEMPRRVNGWYRLNLLLLNIFGGIDKKSGAAWVLVKPTLHIKMVEKEPPPVPPDLARGDPPPDDTGGKPPPVSGPTVLTEEDIVSEDDYDS